MSHSIDIPESFSDDSHNIIGCGKPIFLLFHPFAQQRRFIVLGIFLASWHCYSELTTRAAYNVLLGILVAMKGVTTYRQEMLRGSHSQLREIVIRYVTGCELYVVHIDTDSSIQRILPILYHRDWPHYCSNLHTTIQ